MTKKRKFECSTVEFNWSSFNRGQVQLLVLVWQTTTLLTWLRHCIGSRKSRLVLNYYLAFSTAPRYTYMGLTLPNPEGQMEYARSLMAQKDNIEAELESHISILKANNVTMQTPLVDFEGFPRADIDIFAVRSARVRIIELRNDLKAVMDSIGKALEGIYDPALSTQKDAASPEALKPFSKVEAISPGSPASEAVRRILNQSLCLHYSLCQSSHYRRAISSLNLGAWTRVLSQQAHFNPLLISYQKMKTSVVDTRTEYMLF